jgi:predicted DCC family thiol-disulfide oxidoreductase YuxK
MSSRPLLIFDGDCGFCRRWVERWRLRTGDRVEYAPYQEVSGRLPQVEPRQFEAAVALVEPDGDIRFGAAAVCGLLSYSPGGGWARWIYRTIPGAAAGAEAVYRLVANRRTQISRWMSLVSGPDLSPPSWMVARSGFLRALGLVYFVAFASLAVQVAGLIGTDGILPAEGFLQQIGARFGPRGYHMVPSLFWWGAGDAQLWLACGAGAGLSLLLIAGLAPLPVLAVLWILYLSVVAVGGPFLQFQWDALLLETGFLALFLAPLSLRPGRWRVWRPSSMARILLWWLLFRLMFQSGVVKLASGDPTWRNFSALGVHYETQPLPTWIGWVMHQFPGWFQAGCVTVMFFIELIVPFFIFAPRRLRHWACAALTLLQILILISGNYGYFNFLTLALCLLLLDDSFWRRRLPVRWSLRVPGPETGRIEPGWRRILVTAVAGLVLAVSLPQTARALDRRMSFPGPIVTLSRALGPFRIVNSYGLFAVMTTTRPEITIEGSMDGETWRPYRFRWKPGDPRQRPRFVAPHMPRLDWQMWFAALGSPRSQPWLTHLLQRLLEGSPEVLALLDENPFPERPPRYLRSTLSLYRFTDPVTLWRKGIWWKREARSIYTPVVSLRENGGS